MHAVTRLLFDVAGRMQDPVGLTFKDIFEAKFHNKNRKYVLPPKKTGARTVIIGVEAYEAIQEYYKEKFPERRDQHVDSNRRTVMFPPGKGEDPNNMWVQSVIKWIKKNVPGVDAKTHNFRVTKATEIYKRTNKMKTAQMYLGHKSVATTEMYIKCDEGEMLDEIEGIAE